jgi:hypothetical protein
MNPTYSPNEIHLFSTLNTPLLNSPPRTYESAILSVFVHDKKGPAVEALRRAYRELYLGTTDRNTEKFERILEF